MNLVVAPQINVNVGLNLAVLSPGAQQTLAQIVDVLGSQEARDAHAWLIAADAPTARPAFFARNPSLNIVPRGMRRVPARAAAGGCATAGAARG